jgi:hypothetical protein
MDTTFPNPAPGQIFRVCVGWGGPTKTNGNGTRYMLLMNEDQELLWAEIHSHPSAMVTGTGWY